MLTSIFQWLTESMTGTLEMISGVFLSCLDLRPGAYLEAFPILGDAYRLLQIIGLGLTLVVGTVSLFSFFGFRSAGGQYSETPEQILFRSAISGGLIYGGGYVLEYVIQLASWSFIAFNNLEATPEMRISEVISMEAVAKATGTAILTEGLSDLTLVTVSMLLTALILYNLFKLILEVVERYMIVGVLVFTSPLVYCTVTSSTTSQIFRNWVRMVTSSCIMMSMSSLFLKMIISGLHSLTVGTGYWMQMLLILATCKIAQRVDTYLNQLGLTTATTGGGLLEDIGGVVGAARMIGAAGSSIFNGSSGKGSRNSVLDGSRARTPGASDVRMTGLGGSVINGIRHGRESFINGASVGESAKAAAKAAGETLKRNSIGGAVSGAAEAKRTGGNVAKGTVRGAAKGAAESAAQFIDPVGMNTRRANMAKDPSTTQASNTSTGVGVPGAPDLSVSSSPTGTVSAFPSEIRERIHNGETDFSPEEATENFGKYGVAEEGLSAMSPFGVRPMEEYRQEASEALRTSNPEYAEDCSRLSGSQSGTYEPGSADFISAEAFEGKWAPEIERRASALRIADITGDGMGMELSDRAMAAGLSIADTPDGQSYVRGMDQQTGAFLGNEYCQPDPFPAGAGIQTDEAYQGMAVQALAAEASGISGMEDFSEDMEHMDKESFHAKYESQISAKADEFRGSDIAANAKANADYRDTVQNTAINGGAVASICGFFDHSGTMEGNDRLGNAMLETGFPMISTLKPEGGSFYGIRAFDHDSGSGIGRILEASYRDDGGQEHTVRIYDRIAIASLPEKERAVLHPYTAVSGAKFWTNADLSFSERIKGIGGRIYQSLHGPAAYSEKTSRSGKKKHAKAKKAVKPDQQDEKS